MRLCLFLIWLLTSITAFGQTFTDTVELYNRIPTKKRTEFNSSGEATREWYFHNNGQVQTEYLLKDGRRVQIVTYDTSGAKLSEWNDPEPKNKERLRLRNIIFLVTLVVILALTTWGGKVNYPNMYTALLCIVVIYPFVAFILERRIVSERENIVLAMVIASSLFIFPSLLLALSIFNLFKKTNVPLLTTIFSILVSIGFLFFFIMTFNIAGAGMIG